MSADEVGGILGRATVVIQRMIRLGNLLKRTGVLTLLIYLIDVLTILISPLLRESFLRNAVMLTVLRSLMLDTLVLRALAKLMIGIAHLRCRRISMRSKLMKICLRWSLGLQITRLTCILIRFWLREMTNGLTSGSVYYPHRLRHTIEKLQCTQRSQERCQEYLAGHKRTEPSTVITHIALGLQDAELTALIQTSEPKRDLSALRRT